MASYKSGKDLEYIRITIRQNFSVDFNLVTFIECLYKEQFQATATE